MAGRRAPVGESGMSMAEEVADIITGATGCDAAAARFAAQSSLLRLAEWFEAMEKHSPKLTEMSWWKKVLAVAAFRAVSALLRQEAGGVGPASRRMGAR